MTQYVIVEQFACICAVHSTDAALPLKIFLMVICIKNVIIFVYCVLLFLNNNYNVKEKK